MKRKLANEIKFNFKLIVFSVTFTIICSAIFYFIFKPPIETEEDQYLVNAFMESVKNIHSSSFTYTVPDKLIKPSRYNDYPDDILSIMRYDYLNINEVRYDRFYTELKTKSLYLLVILTSFLVIGRYILMLISWVKKTAD